MKILDNFIEKIGADKLHHFFVGGWICSMFSPLGIVAIIIAFILTLCLSIVKEQFLDDKCELKDILAASLGGVTSIIIYLIIMIFI